MFIILPISHEQQTVQRLPWITFGLIALNIIIFVLLSGGRKDTETAFNEKFDHFLQYYLEHPYLEFPESMREFLSEKDNEEIDLIAESSETLVDPSTKEIQQEELDGLAQEIARAINSHPFRRFGYVPGRPKILNLFTCMFLHDGFFHLFGNMLFLFLAGCSIEDVWGRPLFIAFYFLSGIVASLTFQVLNSDSLIPLVGASGAIAGLMGAFLIRLAKTRIRFFYIIFLLFLGFRTGTFHAPAYVMLPLWLLEQIIYAMVYQSEGGVAFSAHIGGFIFGASIAVAIKMSEIEEKYIAPSIEKKVSLEQNPLFLKGIQLAEMKDYPGALIHLQKVVRGDPNHFEAFMEMRRIAELTGDRKGYNRNMAGIFELLLRNRDYDLFVDLFNQYKDHPFRELLPARTLMAIALFFEEQSDVPAAIDHLLTLVENYNEDPLAMKAYSLLARLYVEKQDERAKALEAFREAYFHPQSSEDWRSAIEIEMKKYGFAREDLGSVSVPAFAENPKQVERAAIAEIEHVAATSNSTDMIRAAQVPVNLNVEHIMLPSKLFDGAYDEWSVVECRIEKIGLKGLILSRQSKVGVLPWKKIRAISVANLKNTGLPERNQGSIIIDLIVQRFEEQNKVVYRIFGSELKFEQIFPRVEQSFDEAYQNLIGIIIRNSGARCIPDRGRVTGPNFLVLSSLAEYESLLHQQRF